MATGVTRGPGADGARPRRRVTGGGFGPYAVDQRDEEIREKRGAKRSDDRRPSPGTGERSALRTVGKRTVRDEKPRGQPAHVGLHHAHAAPA